MATNEQAQWIVPTTGAKTLPVIEILTGRGFITGKSGSGKSNTASVIAEELLDNNYNLLIVDPEGEYYGLKEEYEILHVGNDDRCDAKITPERAHQLAEITLERNMPVILDVSDFLDAEVAESIIANTIEALFRTEKDVRKPFLVMIEEMQEYLPQQGGSSELSELLERVAKRGRKRGLGMLGMSQRPSSVDKDFITQCDWMVWHRLTWQNDIGVVKKVLGSDIADEVEDLNTGEGFLMTDWDESVERVQFQRKRTHDAGATPGLESYERPDLKSVSADLVRDLTDDADTDVGASGGASIDASMEDSTVVTPTEVEDGSLDETLDETLLMGEKDLDPSVQSSDAPTAVEDLDLDSLGEIADGQRFDELDEDDLRRLSKALWRRNQVLEDEVAELRTILESVSVPADGSTARAEDSTVQRTSPPAFQRQKPRPPDPPERREGIAGNLVELVYMVIYLTRVMFYRIHLAFHRLRYRNSARPE